MPLVSAQGARATSLNLALVKPIQN